MFGQFLLERGLVDEAALEKALALQQSTRPTFEDLIRVRGLLSDTQILDLRGAAEAAEHELVDLAVTRGLLAPEQFDDLLAARESARLPIGEALIRLALIERTAMEAALLDYWSHDGRPAEVFAPPARRPQPVERLKMLCRLVHEVGERGKRDQTLEHLLLAAREGVPCDCGFLATVDSEQHIKIEQIWETRDRVPGVDQHVNKVEDLEANHTAGIYRSVASTGKPFRSGDVEADNDSCYMPGWQGVQSNVTVPILSPGGRVIGVLLLESVQPAAFTAEDQAFLEILAAYAAMAIEHAGQTERRAKEGRILWDFGNCMRKADQGVVTTEGTLRVLEQVLDLCLDEVGANQGFIALLDAGRSVLDISILKGDRVLPDDERPKSIPLGEGITGQAAMRGVPLLVNDVLESEEFIPFFEDMKSELAVPLIHLGQVIAVLNVESRRHDAFTAAHVDYCARLADTFAPLVQAAQFFDYTLDRFGVGIQLVGGSLAMERLKGLLAKAARSEAAIMLIGESGTGKEYIAKHIHFNSRRRAGPFEVISCTNTQPELVESDLFGHVSGSFTGAVADKPGLFEVADGGTILLDEIGDLPLDLQGKLLRVLQEGTYRRIGATETRRTDVRIITATNRNLKQMVEDQSFRQDLFFRLDQVRIIIPPLRERREDILLLTDHFVRKYGEIENREIKGLDEDALALLWRRDWPGNVRELEYFVYKLIIFTEEPVISGEDLQRVAAMFDVELKPKVSTKLAPELLRHEIEMALNATRTENRLFKARATRYLGWDKNTLTQKMKALEIEG